MADRTRARAFFNRIVARVLEVTGTLTVGDAIAAPVNDYSAGSGQGPGTQSLLSLVEYDGGGGDYQALRIGDLSGLIEAELVPDSFWGGWVYVPNRSLVCLAGAYNPATVFTAKQAALSSGGLTLQGAPAVEGQYGGPAGLVYFQAEVWPEGESVIQSSASLQFLITSLATGNGELSFRFDNDDPVFRVRKSDGATLIKLPTADPLEAGVLWNNAGTPAISAGA